MFAQIISLATWLLLPVSVIVIVDDWFLRPRRRLAALPAADLRVLARAAALLERLSRRPE